jgi:hypothetical protein
MKVTLELDTETVAVLRWALSDYGAKLAGVLGRVVSEDNELGTAIVGREMLALDALQAQLAAAVEAA